MTPSSDRVAVRAAGGLIVRGGPSELEVALIHRPRYDDWTIPKGKADPDETPAEAARREVREETGLLGRIVGRAGTNCYQVAEGLKQVDYFLMRPYRSEGFSINEEVDELAWVGTGEARHLLTHGFDAGMVASLDSDAVAAHSHLHLVRHGAAGDRSHWVGRDDRRPLTEKGMRQAEGLADELADLGIARILSSPYVRCVQTVEPLARRLGVEIETHDALAEGAGRRQIASLLAEVAGTTAVLCSHGDVIPTALDVLASTGVRFNSRFDCKKGSTWAVAHDGSRFTEADYLEPPG